jgi:sugar lactone lactonase YvrE
VSAQVELIILAQALNGARPGWHPFQKRLFWADIRGPSLHAFDPSTGRDEAWEMPAWIGGFAATERGAVVALRTGLYDFDAETGALAFLAPAPFDPRRFLFNDGRCDRKGRFFAGPMYLPLAPGDQSLDPKTSPLWLYDPRGFWSAATPPVSTSNGLAWSPDGKTMYHADTGSGTIWAHDYDSATGKAENRRVFAQVEVAQGGPNGACVDADGFYWCALFANSCLLRIDPKGKIERRVPMPVKYPTMPAFGGDDLKTLFITSANWPLSPEERLKQPDEGGLFALEAPAPGLPPSTFKSAGGR